MITVVGNLKGGTGKSTVAFNLALWLLARKRKVMLCDLDPQGTLRDAADVRLELGYEPELAAWGRIPQKTKDEVLIDVGVSDMDAARMAIERADRILIPVAPSQADVWSTQRFLEMIEEYASAKKPPELVAFLNRADTHPASRENREATEALRELGDLTVLRPRLCQRMAFRRSFSEGLGVFELEPRGKAARELQALARAVFGESKK